MKSLHAPDGLRVDGPDFRAMSETLLEQRETELLRILLPAGTVLPGVAGVLYNMNPLVGTLNVLTVIAGAFVDVNRKYVVMAGSPTVDIAAIVNVNGSKIWGRVSSTKLITTTENRVIIVGGTETVNAQGTRREDVLELQATTGSTPSGSGWTLIMTINTWATAMGITAPQNYTMNMLADYGSFWAFCDRVKTEIAELKGNADWTAAPTRNMLQLHQNLDTAEARISNSAIPTSVMKAWATVQVNSGSSTCTFKTGTKHSGISSITYVGVGTYDVNFSPPLDATEAAHLAMIFAYDSTDVDITFVWTPTVNGGGQLTKIRVLALTSATGFLDEADNFRVVVF